MKSSNRRIVITIPFLMDLMKAKFPHIEFVGTPYIDFHTDCIGFNVYIPGFDIPKAGEEIKLYRPELVK